MGSDGERRLGRNLKVLCVICLQQPSSRPQGIWGKPGLSFLADLQRDFGYFEKWHHAEEGAKRPPLLQVVRYPRNKSQVPFCDWLHQQ